MLICYYVFKTILCLFDGAKVRRFPHTHNRPFVAFRIPKIWYEHKSRRQNRLSVSDLYKNAGVGLFLLIATAFMLLLTSTTVFLSRRGGGGF